MTKSALNLKYTVIQKSSLAQYEEIVNDALIYFVRYCFRRQKKFDASTSLSKNFHIFAQPLATCYKTPS